ncbi:MAG: DUF177 domain-containing protein [Deltaproteobacteria bacterium]|jgi:uncharacterized protein|nr:DUF177 domain-containing protein [Deltaproteobacteria bacterium]
MAADWILLHTVSPSGKKYVLDDQGIWAGPIAEFSLDCTILEPLKAVFTVFVQEDGVLIRGELTGTVSVPCDRCAEDAVVKIAQRVETYEGFPVEGAEQNDLDVDTEILRFSPTGQGMEMNLAGLAWEEFSLALPMKPLCDPGCKGLCPSCGANRNTASCSCSADALDPRMAPLRGLKLGR